MKQYASFERYLEDKYYNDIHRAITGLIYKRGRNNGFYSYTVLDPSYFQVDDIHVKTVSFHSTEGNQIIFNAAVQADVVLKGIGKRDYDADMTYPWYTVSFIGYLSDGLNMVTITNVEDYSPDKFDKNTTLSKYLVPYLYAEDIEKEAEKFLIKYCRQALKEPMPIPLEELLFNMGLELYEAPLPDNIFGKTYFAEAIVDVFNEDGDVVSQTIDPGTILINPNIFFMRNIGSRNNTVVHECVHWDRHDKFFELQKLLNSDITSLSCEITEHVGQKDAGLEGALQWIEWQANALAPRILLPANTTRRKLNEILQRLHIDGTEKTESEIMEEAIQELAEFFEVSKYAAKLRAIELGFTQAKGVWNYVNGKYLPSFSFKDTALKKDESFIIDTCSHVPKTTFWNNPWLKRYVAPDDGLLGKNQYGNHWNQDKPDGRQVCVHAFIGKLADGSIATYQTLPWNHRGWHAGGAANDTHIGFEICEDNLSDATYFRKVFSEAVELCVYLCKLYNLTENDIICHSEGYKLGIASNHADVMHWFPRHGESMDTFRAAVKAGLVEKPETEMPAGDDKKYYRVQVGAFSSKANAESMLKKLKAAGFDGFIKYS